MDFGQIDPTPDRSFPPDASQLSKETIDFYSYQSLLLNQVHVAVIGTDERLVIRYFNQAAEKLLGWKAEEAVGKSTAEVIRADISAAERDKIRDRLFQEGCVELGIASYNRAGQPLFLELRATKLAGAVARGYVVTIRDLTEEKQNETAQKQNEERIHQLNQELAQRNTELTIERERWQGVVEGIAEEVWVCDLQGNAGLMNLRTVSPMGLEEFRDKPLDQVLEEMELLEPDGRVRQPKHAPLLRALSGEIVRGEEILRHPRTGNARYRQYSVAPTRAPDGTITGAVGILRDITDYKLAEQAVKASQERLQLATEAAQLGTWEWRSGQDYSITNEIFCHIHGIEPTLGLINKLADFMSLVHPEDRERVRDVILRSTQGQPVEDRPYRIIRPDGAVRWMQPFRKNIFEGGQLVRQIGAVMDITERVVSELALRESEERFRIALSNAAIDVFSTDRELRYTWYYTSAPADYAREYYGKRDDEILPAENIAQLMALKRQALDSLQEIRAEIIVRVSDGERNWIVTVEPLYDALGQPVGVIGACQDVTDLRRLQAQQIEYATQVEVQRRLMEQREQDRQSIARDIHDGPIQTLSSTIFSLQYLKEAVHVPAMQVELEQARLNVKSAVQELRDVINELRPPALLRFGLARAIEQHAEYIRERRPEIDLRLVLSPDENQLEESVRLVLFRVYQEGTNNIIRHAEASQVMVRFDLNERDILLEIADNGKGFEVPADFSGLTQHQHYGLAGMKERVQSIGGTLEVESKQGEGTKVRAQVVRMKV